MTDIIGYLEHLDHQLFFALNQGLSNPLLDYLLWWVAVLANGTVLVLVSGICLWFLDRQAFKKDYGWLILAVLAGGIITQVFKYGLVRPRPLEEFAALLNAGEVQFNVIGQHLRFRSFPSGHTQATASVMTYLTHLYPRFWYVWCTFIVLVGLSRVYLGVHFPSDVLAGAIIGGLSAWSAWRLQYYLIKKMS